MSELSIKLNIAGRIYPLTIKREEEEAIRKAAKHIEASIKSFQENYAVRDKQDLLAMTSLQLATQLQKPGGGGEDAQLKSELDLINTKLQQALTNS
ncbi:MAG: cell division protein ZapA [Flavobacteriales bacterium]